MKALQYFILYLQSNGLSYGERNRKCLIPLRNALNIENIELPSIWHYLFPKTARQGHGDITTTEIMDRQCTNRPFFL